ncbi:hypothetical protein B0H13DRAFT_2308852 [Mycena leptocephala]|nr:hypothetical protein B0H13DRAFT_2308852 [Mycena leptocephala]
MFIYRDDTSLPAVKALSLLSTTFTAPFAKLVEFEPHTTSMSPTHTLFFFGPKYPYAMNGAPWVHRVSPRLRSREDLLHSPSAYKIVSTAAHLGFAPTPEAQAAESTSLPASWSLDSMFTQRALLYALFIICLVLAATVVFNQTRLEDLRQRVKKVKAARPAKKVQKIHHIATPEMVLRVPALSSTNLALLVGLPAAPSSSPVFFPALIHDTGDAEADPQPLKTQVRLMPIKTPRPPKLPLRRIPSPSSALPPTARRLRRPVPARFPPPPPRRLFKRRAFHLPPRIARRSSLVACHYAYGRDVLHVAGGNLACRRAATGEGRGGGPSSHRAEAGAWLGEAAPHARALWAEGSCRRLSEVPRPRASKRSRESGRRWKDEAEDAHDAGFLQPQEGRVRVGQGGREDTGGGQDEAGREIAPWTDYPQRRRAVRVGWVGRMASGPKKAVVDVKGKGRQIIS